MSLNSLGVRLASPIKAVSTSRTESPSIFPQSERDDLLAKVESSRESSPIEGLLSGIPSPDPTQRHDERNRTASGALTHLAVCSDSNGLFADPPELSQAPHGKPVRPTFVRTTPTINPI